ncbi:angiomotin-like protein 1 isoform X2 [Adelges cooleyi]|uniref:angiomotin-like protein 1 isoform X2 n=1 Tax=Adelges cooleyi TaxID=133065 RepID=UPI00217FFB67|nr:angiomotin-like protein 1 isoform X2 [Adelges cooleyi]
MSSQRSGKNNVAYRSYSTKTHSTKVLSGDYSGSESESYDDTHDGGGRRSAVRQEPQGQETHKDYTVSTPPSAYDTLIIHHDEGGRYGSAIPKYRYGGGGGGGNRDETRSQGQKNGTRQNNDVGVREITNIPDDYLSQSHVLKHLAKEVKVDPPNKQHDTNLSRWHDADKNKWLPDYHRQTPIRNLVKSKSQPDLGMGSMKIERLETDPMRHTLGNNRKDQKMLSIVDCLMMENKSLKIELESCHQKVAKSYRLEQEVSKVYRSHQEMVESSERRERLEHTARLKLQAEVRRLQEANRSLRDQLLSSNMVDPNQMVKRETMIAQLITQNKELLAAKDRQEIELAAQRATLEEQRTHIDILDTALTNAQSNVVRLEEECRKKQMHVERVAQLQRALSSLQLASDRREQTERKLRLQLERELRNERARNNNTSQDGSTDNEPGESLPELKRMLREKDEKIMRLEGEVAKWEQRYLEESELRQAAIDAASIPKDAKIAALEKTGQESEKLIAEARSDRLKQMEEVHAAQKKVSELESRMKELESRLAERDAMIRVLQKKHTFEKDVSGSYPSICLGHHTPHSSLNTTDLTSDDLGFGSNNSYTSSVDSSYHHHHGNKYSSANQSFDHKSLDDQLKELDSQLLNKASLIRALCHEKQKHPNHYWRV